MWPDLFNAIPIRLLRYNCQLCEGEQPGRHVGGTGVGGLGRGQTRGQSGRGARGARGGVGGPGGGGGGESPCPGAVDVGRCVLVRRPAGRGGGGTRSPGRHTAPGEDRNVPWRVGRETAESGHCSRFM